MSTVSPPVNADEVFAVNKNVRWVGLVTEEGEVLLNQMRPGVRSYSPLEVDEKLLQLGPLTLLGVEERYSEYLKGVQEIVVFYGVTFSVYAKLDSQVIAISIEEGDEDALPDVRAWLRKKRSELAKTSQQ